MTTEDWVDWYLAMGMTREEAEHQVLADQVVEDPPFAQGAE